MSEVDSTAAEPAAAAPVEVPSVGQRLRAERERQGLSVADVAQRLKYAPRQVQALEADDVEAMRGLTFARGFVRAYARFLGLDADALVRGLEAAAGHDSGPSTVQLQSVSVSRGQFPMAGGQHHAGWPWMIAIVLVVAGLGGYSLYHWQAPAPAAPRADASRAPAAVQLTPPAPVAATEPAPGPATGAPATAGALPAATEARPEAAASASAAPATAASATTAPAAGAPAPGAATGQPRIRLLFNGESWTEIRDASGRVVLSRNNIAGTEQSADGQPPFELVVGNARDVRLFYNGAEVDLGPHIKVSVARLQLR
ncbi:MAG: helix-turn-helix domain-containing protein [Burkholderiales bacterium]|nr:helix-turn-helix domain-containing protein [Burkholderiales bacterium]